MVQVTTLRQYGKGMDMAMKNPVTTKTTPARSRSMAGLGNKGAMNLLMQKEEKASRTASEAERNRGERCWC